MAAEKMSDECLQSGQKMFVSRIIHKAMIEVNETGTTAAAATASRVQRLCARIPSPEYVRVDRPFLFLVMSSSDLVCFAGICARP